MSGKKVNVAWISGAYYQAKPVLDKIKEKVQGAETFVCSSTTPFNLLYEAMKSNFCFGSNRFILINELPEMTDSEKKKFKALLENVSEDILITFFMLDPSSEKSIYTIVEKVGRVYDFLSTVALYDAKGWVDKRCEELGIKLEDNAKTAMIENCGLNEKRLIDLDILNMALEKLTLFAPGKKLYDLNDVITTSSYYDNFIIWDILNACNEKDYEKCLNLFEKCILSRAGPKDALNEIINILVWKYRMLIFLKEGMATKRKNGTPDIDLIIAEASAMRKITYKGQGFAAETKIDPIQTGDNQGKPSVAWGVKLIRDAIFGEFGRKPALEFYNRKELYLIMKCLEDCLILIRSCQSENEANLIADIIFMTICSAGDSKVPKSLQDNLLSMRV